MRSEDPAGGEAPVAARAAPLSLRAVNGWRGPGALAIAIGHFSVVADFVSYRHLEPLVLVVDMFFVFSGLVIAQAYSATLARPAAIPAYIVRRLGRIWPLQAATLALLVAYEIAKLAAQTFLGHRFSSPAFSADGYNLLQAIPTNLLLLHSLGLHDRETWNFPSWSLSVEFATYVFFAGFCLVRQPLRRILAILSIAGSLIVLAAVAPYQMRSTYDYGIFRCFAGFFAGTLCYDAARRCPRPRWPLATLVEVGALLLVIVWMIVLSRGPLVFAAPLVFCVFVLAFIGERGAISRLLMTKPLQALAELSFSIYMMHAIILVGLLGSLHAFDRATGRSLFARIVNPFAGHPGAPPTVEILRLNNPAALWACAAVYVVAVLTAATAAYHWVEVPGRAYFARLAKRIGRGPARAPEATSIVEAAESRT